MKKALILGGLGFVGFQLAKKLIELDFWVDIVDQQNQLQNSDLFFLKHSHVSYHQIDLCSTIVDYFHDDYDYIFHFAALLGVENVSKAPYSVLQKNSLMTFSALEIAKKQKNLKQFFFASTSEVYAGTLHYYSLDFPTQENTPLTITPLENERTAYMLSKIYGESLCHHSGVPFVILRFHKMYGPRMGMRHVIPQLLKKAFYLKNKEDLEVYSPTHTRAFCYIDDAIQYIIKLLDIPDTHLVLNLGVEFHEITMHDLALKIREVIGKNFSIKPMPDTAGSPSRRVPSTERLINLTSYTSQTHLMEGLHKTFLWYKKNEFQT